MKLNINELKKYKDLLLFLNKTNFMSLDHSVITIDENGVSTDAGAKDDKHIKYRDSLVICTLALNLLLLVIEKWDSIDEKCGEFIEYNLEMITIFMEESKNEIK